MSNCDFSCLRYQAPTSTIKCPKQHMLKIYVGHVMWVGEELLAKVQIMRDIYKLTILHIFSQPDNRDGC